MLTNTFSEHSECGGLNTNAAVYWRDSITLHLYIKQITVLKTTLSTGKSEVKRDISRVESRNDCDTELSENKIWKIWWQSVKFYLLCLFFVLYLISLLNFSTTWNVFFPIV